MTDRQPSPGKEGRIKITPENGQPAFYAKIEMADNALEEGTPYSKGTVVSSSVEQALGLSGDPTPADALLKVAELIKANTNLANSKARVLTGTYVGDGTYGEDNPTEISVESEPFFAFIANVTGFSFNLYGTSNVLLYVKGLQYTRVEYDGSKSAQVSFNYNSSTKKFQYFSDDPSGRNADYVQLNQSGETYAYVIVY